MLVDTNQLPPLPKTVQELEQVLEDHYYLRRLDIAAKWAHVHRSDPALDHLLEELLTTNDVNQTIYIKDPFTSELKTIPPEIRVTDACDRYMTRYIGIHMAIAANRTSLLFTHVLPHPSSNGKLRALKYCAKVASEEQLTLVFPSLDPDYQVKLIKALMKMKRPQIASALQMEGNVSQSTVKSSAPKKPKKKKVIDVDELVVKIENELKAAEPQKYSEIWERYETEYRQSRWSRWIIQGPKNKRQHAHKALELQEMYPPTRHAENGQLYTSLNFLIRKSFVGFKHFLRLDPERAMKLVKDTCLRPPHKDPYTGENEYYIEIPEDLINETAEYWAKHPGRISLLIDLISFIIRDPNYLMPFRNQSMWKVGTIDVQLYVFNECIQPLNTVSPEKFRNFNRAEHWQYIGLVCGIISELDSRLSKALKRRISSQTALKYVDQFRLMIQRLNPFFTKMFEYNVTLFFNHVFKHLLSHLYTWIPAQILVETLHALMSLKGIPGFTSTGEILRDSGIEINYLFRLLKQKTRLEQYQNYQVNGYPNIGEPDNSRLLDIVVRGFCKPIWHIFVVYNMSTSLTIEQQDRLFDLITDEDWVNGYYDTKDPTHATNIVQMLLGCKVSQSKKHRIVTLLYSSIPEGFSLANRTDRPLDACLDLTDVDVFKAAKNACLCQSWEERYTRFSNLLHASVPAGPAVWLETFEFVFGRIKNESTQNLTRLSTDFFYGPDRKAFLEMTFIHLSDSQTLEFVQLMQSSFERFINMGSDVYELKEFFKFVRESCFQRFLYVPSDPRFQMAVNMSWLLCTTTSGLENVLDSFTLPDLTHVSHDFDDTFLTTRRIKNSAIVEGKEMEAINSILSAYKEKYAKYDIDFHDQYHTFVDKLKDIFLLLGAKWMQMPTCRKLVEDCIHEWKSLPQTHEFYHQMKIISDQLLSCFQSIPAYDRVKDSLYHEASEFALSLNKITDPWTHVSSPRSLAEPWSEVIEADWKVNRNGKSTLGQRRIVYEQLALNSIDSLTSFKLASNHLFDYFQHLLPKTKLPLSDSDVTQDYFSSDETDVVITADNQYIFGKQFPYLNRLSPNQILFFKTAFKKHVESANIGIQQKRAALEKLMLTPTLSVSEMTQFLSDIENPATLLWDQVFRNLHNIDEPMSAVTFLKNSDALQSESAHSATHALSELLKHVDPSAKIQLLTSFLGWKQITTGKTDDGNPIIEKRGPKTIVAKTVIRIVMSSIQHKDNQKLIRQLWSSNLVNSGARLVLLYYLAQALSHPLESVRSLAWNILKDASTSRNRVLDGSIAALLHIIYDTASCALLPIDISSVPTVQAEFSIDDALSKWTRIEIRVADMTKYAESVLLPLALVDHQSEERSEDRDKILEIRCKAIQLLTMTPEWILVDKSDYFSSQLFTALHTLSPTFVFPSPVDLIPGQRMLIFFVTHVFKCLGFCVYRNPSKNSSAWQYLKDIIARWKNIFIDLGWDQKERFLCLEWLEFMRLDYTLLFTKQDKVFSGDDAIDARQLTACIGEHWLSNNMLWDVVLRRELNILMAQIRPTSSTKSLDPKSIDQAKSFLAKFYNIASQHSTDPSKALAIVDSLCADLRVYSGFVNLSPLETCFASHIFGEDRFPAGSIWFLKTQLHLFKYHSLELGYEALHKYFCYALKQYPSHMKTHLNDYLETLKSYRKGCDEFIPLANEIMESLSRHYLSTDLDTDTLSWELDQEVVYWLYCEHSLQFTQLYPDKLGPLLHHVLTASENHRSDANKILKLLCSDLRHIYRSQAGKSDSIMHLEENQDSSVDFKHISTLNALNALLCKIIWKGHVRYLDLSKIMHTLKDIQIPYNNAASLDLDLYSPQAPSILLEEDTFSIIPESSHFMQKQDHDASILLHQTRLFTHVFIWPELRSMLQPPFVSAVSDPGFLSTIHDFLPKLADELKSGRLEPWESLFAIINQLYNGVDFQVEASRGPDGQRLCIYYSFLIFKELIGFIVSTKVMSENNPAVAKENSPIAQLMIPLRNLIREWYNRFSGPGAVFDITRHIVNMMKDETTSEVLLKSLNSTND